MALAYFITFTTYGTWLHGSAKGSVDADHNTYDTPVLEQDIGREAEVREALGQPPYTLDEQGERMAWYTQEPRTK